LVTNQNIDQLQRLKSAKVTNIQVSSFEGDGMQDENFAVTQTINGNYTRVVTNSKSSVANESELATWYDNNGRILKTTDTTDGFSSTTEYKYDNEGRLIDIRNVSSSAGQSRETEEHRWSFTADGKPERMLKIKNGSDTTYVTFVLDENGNVVEENARRKNNNLPSYYYYYDSNNRLTDIVRYNQKAGRLLPDYVFEYNDKGLISSMLVVPEGSDDYQRWYYEYNESGLKVKESCYNKRRQLLGRIEYRYR
jgi:YD repeat-containing protein